MKKNIENLLKTAKIVCGRQLSEKQMEKAISEEEEKENKFLVRANKRKNIKRVIKLESGEYEKFEQNFRLMQTPDASRGWEKIHEGYYLSKTTKTLYDEEGKIKLKFVLEGNPYEMGDSYLKLFEPAGSWFGKKK
jgi:hypothetical protein